MDEIGSIILEYIAVMIFKRTSAERFWRVKPTANGASGDVICHKKVDTNKSD